MKKKLIKTITRVFIAIFCIVLFPSCSTAEILSDSKITTQAVNQTTTMDSHKVTEAQNTSDTSEGFSVKTSTGDTMNITTKTGSSQSRTLPSNSVVPTTKTENQKNIRIACVGDSITEGVGSSNKQLKSYPAQLQTLLGSNYNVGNFGRGGATVASYRNTTEYAASINFLPDIVIIMLGTNDCINMKSETAKTAWKNNFRILIDKYKNLPSRPEIYVATSMIRSDYLQRIWTLENVIVPMQREIAKEKRVKLIDVYNLTKEFFQSHFFNAGDRLHPKDEGYAVLAKTIYNGIKSGMLEKIPETITPTPGKVVYVKSSGSISNDGSTPDKAVNNFNKAVSLCKGGGTIVITGLLTVNRTIYAPENKHKITVTSVYGGKDYRNEGAKITFGSSFEYNQGMYLFGEYEFNNIIFEAGHNNLTLSLQYNNVTFGTGIVCRLKSGATRHIAIECGYTVSSLLQSEQQLSLNRNCTVTVKSGTYAYIRGGNTRPVTPLPSKDSVDPGKYPYGGISKESTLSIVIDGGTFENLSGSNAAAAELTTATGMGGCAGNILMVINGGIFKGADLCRGRNGIQPDRINSGRLGQYHR